MASLTDQYGLDDFPWDKREAETEHAWTAFIVYRDLGPRRTLRRAAQIFYEQTPEEFNPKGGKQRVFERWSAENAWVSRAEAFDRYTQALKDEDAEAAIIAMKSRHAAIATAAQSKLVAAINSVDPTKMTLRDIAYVFDIAVRNERLARGVPASVDAIQIGDDSPRMEALDDDALTRKLNAWMAARDPANRIEAGEPGGPDDDEVQDPA